MPCRRSRWLRPTPTSRATSVGRTCFASWSSPLPPARECGSSQMISGHETYVHVALLQAQACHGDGRASTRYPKALVAEPRHGGFVANELFHSAARRKTKRLFLSVSGDVIRNKLVSVHAGNVVFFQRVLQWVISRDNHTSVSGKVGTDKVLIAFLNICGGIIWQAM